MRPARSTFAVPALLGVVSLVGLLSALLADGLWDALSWLTLGAVVGVALWFGYLVPALPRSARSLTQAQPPNEGSP